MEQYDRNNGLTGMITIQAANDAISNLRGNPGYISEEEYNTKIQNIVNKTMEQKKMI
jgi:4-hydroxy-3-methylbut-2-en-1-yl diphosphate synthase IspG/GcpE